MIARVVIGICTLLLLALFTCGPALAAGIALYEIGTSDVGLATAGYAARAQDASTLFKNPAGMSRLGKSELEIGIQALYGDLNFSPGASTNVPGNDGGNPIGFLPGGGIFYAQSISSDLKAGLGIFSYFGMNQKYDDGWVGRYYVKESNLVGYTIMPAVSYRISRWLSVGAGLNAMYGTFNEKIAVTNNFPVPTGLPDGELKLKNEEWGFGADLGVLVEASDRTRFGLTYLSEVKLDFSTTSEFSGLGPVMQFILASRGLLNAEVDLKMYVPQMLIVSGYHEINDKWALMGSVGWQDWSRFGKMDITVNSATSTSLAVDRDYQDTWSIALGLQYRASPVWTFTGGVGYDSSPVKDEHRTVDFAVGEVYRLGMGAQWQMNPAVSLGLSYELVWMGDLSVDQDRGFAGHVAGSFDDSAIHFLAFTMRWNP